MKKTLRIIIGILFIIIGLIGFLVPVVPGFALLFVGLELAGIGFLIPGFVRRFISDLYRRWKHRHDPTDKNSDVQSGLPPSGNRLAK